MHKRKGMQRQILLCFQYFSIKGRKYQNYHQQLNYLIVTGNVYCVIAEKTNHFRYVKVKAQRIFLKNSISLNFYNMNNNKNIILK